MADDFIRVHRNVVGAPSRKLEDCMKHICELGYWPLKIKAVPEGSVMDPRNVLMTIASTSPEFCWSGGFMESLLLKVWYPTTVGSCSYRYRQLARQMWNKTVPKSAHGWLEYAVHDFGYRGDTSEESAQISGMAHLMSFVGSDTIPAYPYCEEYYDATENDGPIMLSIPASEHSVMCSFGRDEEFAAFENMLNLYPSGPVSIVSDTFDVYNVLTNFVARLKNRILARDGKIVFRPDSGNPEKIICGDPDAPVNSPQWKGCIRLLHEMFGAEPNAAGYLELNPKVGLIYGDGMYFERYERALNRLAEMGYASSNLIIGVGGILRNHSRDTLGFATKATYVTVNGVPREIEKDPVTDPGKKSFKGFLHLEMGPNGWVTTDRATPEQEDTGLLKTVFYNGKMVGRQTLTQIRQTLRASEPQYA